MCKPVCGLYTCNVGSFGLLILVFVLVLEYFKRF